MPPSNFGMDVGATGGGWLFKQGDLLLGPVPFERLVEMLYAGEVDATTPVSQQGGEPGFVPLGEIESLRVHLAKSQAKLRVEAQSVEKKRGERRGHLLRLAGIGAVSLVVLLGGGRLAWWLALNRPWEKRIELPEATITDELPVVRFTSARGRQDEELAYVEPAAPSDPTRPSRPAAKTGRPGGGGTSGTAGALASRGPNAADLKEDEVHSVQQWDQEAINGIVRQKKKSLHRCLSEEAARQSGGWSARVPIEFTIGNDGRVSKLWIDNPDYKRESSALHKCMGEELGRWRFPAYAGEQANVSLAFQVKGR